MANPDNIVDLNQVINASSKIPDPIKMLPNYDVDTKNLISWINSVKVVVNLYGELQNNPIYRVWIQAIRSKIVVNANDTLSLNNVNNDWAAIKQNLLEYFGDRRDLATLAQNIPYMKQGAKSIEEFYQEVIELDSKINQKIRFDTNYILMALMSQILLIRGIIDPKILSRHFTRYKSSIKQMLVK